MALRISGQPPTLVGKPFDGPSESPQWQQGELVKLELQRFLRILGEASDQAQIDIADILEGTRPAGSKALHPFLLSGM